MLKLAVLGGTMGVLGGVFYRLMARRPRPSRHQQVNSHPQPTQEQKSASAANTASYGTGSKASPPKSLVRVRGFMYVVPYEHRQRHSMKDARVGETLVHALGVMFRRHGGKQPLEESIAFWRAEIEAGRVRLRRHKKTRDDNGPYTQDFCVAPADEVIQRKDQVQILSHVHERAVPSATPTVLYEDDRIMVFNKPAGLACQDHSNGPTMLANLVMILHGRRLHLAHRLDKPVSGCLVFAKQPSARKMIAADFEAHRCTKIYLARVHGHIPEPSQYDPSRAPATNDACKVTASAVEFTIESPLYWHSKLNRMKMVPRNDRSPPSKVFRTLVRPLKHYKDGTTLVRVRLITGHRHQIRVHMEGFGYPIANDATYSGPLPPTPCVVSAEYPHPATPIYADDKQGTLLRAFTSSQAWREWCPKCHWVRRQIAGTDSEFGPPPVPCRVWLHSWRYKVPCLNLDVTSPFPAFANTDPLVPLGDTVREQRGHPIFEELTALLQADEHTWVNEKSEHWEETDEDVSLWQA